MRAGARRNDWTVAEEAYLRENAGLVPKREICMHLKKSAEAVKSKARHMRDAGEPVCLRYYTPKMHPCPFCGCLSATLDRTGVCEPCRRREQLARIHARIAHLLQKLPLDERDIYADTEAETESRSDPLPKAPNLKGLSRYAAAKCREEHARQTEAVLAANLRRRIKAAQKRKERIEKKLKSMPL